MVAPQQTQEPLVDQLIAFKQLGVVELREVVVLDLRRYISAVQEGRSVPLFGPVNASGAVMMTRTRHLRPAQVTHVIASPLSPEFYERAHGVPEIIVRDLRRRAAGDRLPPRT